MKLSGWGRFPVLDCNLIEPRDESDIRFYLKQGPLIARGAGRSYGDSALNVSRTLSMRKFNKMLAFDKDAGVLICESGVILADIIKSLLSQGWFPPVVPGTNQVTIGGMIAADVHGKNHHKHGSFGLYVRWLDLMDAQGQILRCSREDHTELFECTIGGMGLTGVILRIAFDLQRIESGWMRQETLVAENLDGTMDALEASEGWNYAVAWLDCQAEGARSGRGIIYRAEHATKAEVEYEDLSAFPRTKERHISIPGLGFPRLLNRQTSRVFNATYFTAGRRRGGRSLVQCDKFFFPLDAIENWNLLYGAGGFVQFQCVLPLENSRNGIASLLNQLRKDGQGAFLAVLKKLGPETGLISFPMAGYTLALDLPATKSALRTVDRFYAIAVEHGGRFYLAKDARLDAETLRKSDARLEKFTELRTKFGASNAFRSSQSERLFL